VPSIDPGHRVLRPFSLRLSPSPPSRAHLVNGARTGRAEHRAPDSERGNRKLVLSRRCFQVVTQLQLVARNTGVLISRAMAQASSRARRRQTSGAAEIPTGKRNADVGWSLDQMLSLASGLAEQVAL
jgi:hypothetical protein